jgi:hypothetical protein
MGVFSKVTKTVKNIAKNPTNVRNYADAAMQAVTLGQVDTNGINTSAVKGGKDVNFKDLLLGKKAKDINPDDIANQIRATQTQGLGELNSALDTPSENVVREANQRQVNSVLTSAQDARRNAQASMARTGLKGSSLGLATNRSIDQQTGRDVSSINAALPGQIRDQQIQDATTRIGAGGINQNGMNFNTIQGARSGGLLGYASQLAPLAGSIGQLMGGMGALNAAKGAASGVQANPNVTTGGINSPAYNPNKYQF